LGSIPSGSGGELAGTPLKDTNLTIVKGDVTVAADVDKVGGGIVVVIVVVVVVVVGLIPPHDYYFDKEQYYHYHYHYLLLPPSVMRWEGG